MDGCHLMTVAHDQNVKRVKVFHSGLITDEDDIWPFTHFGNKDAAMFRARQKVVDTHPNHMTDLYLYACEIALPDDPLVLEDWHAAATSGLILGLENAGRLSFSPLKRIRVMRHINDLAQNDERAARMYVADFIKNIETEVILYPNAHEDPTGDISYCVINPKRVLVMGRTALDVDILRQKLPKWNATPDQLASS